MRVTVKQENKEQSASLITQGSNNAVTIKQKNKKEVVTVGIQGPAGSTPVVAISDATDVELSDVRDGSVLVYSTENSKWTATTKLEKQVLEGGQF